MARDREVREGEFLYFTDGSYSDYEVTAFARALRDFNVSEAVRLFLALHRPTNPCEQITTREERHQRFHDPQWVEDVWRPYWESRPTPSGLIAYLQREGYIEELDAIELHDLLDDQDG